MTREKRKHQRVQAKNVSAHLNVADRSSPCVIHNISAGGLFVETGDALPVGMPVAINLARPGWTSVLRVSGRVVWAMASRTAQKKGATPGMRIKFDSLPRDIAKSLAELLRDLGAAPSITVEESTATPAKADGHITQPVSLREIQARVSQPEMPAVVPPPQASPEPPDDSTLLARGGPADRTPLEVAPVAQAPSSRLEQPLAPTLLAPAAQAAEGPRLIVQVQGLLMQLGELQQKLEARERELEGVRQRLHDKEQELEKADRERRAAELAIQRLSMQLAARR